MFFVNVTIVALIHDEIAMMKEHHSRSYLLLSALLFFFFVTWSASGSLLPIWLHQEVGLKASDTGIIYAVLSVSALFAQVCYGFIQDKLGLRKNLLWYITVLLILSGPAYLLFGYLLKINIIMGSIFGGIYVGLTFNGGIGVLETYTERVARQTHFEFGRARMWGSLGWAVATFFAGILFNIDPKLNFAVASCSGLVFLFLLSRLHVVTDAQTVEEEGAAGKVKLEDALRLLTLPHFWALVFFVVGTCIYGVYDQQFPVYFSSQFPTLQEGNAMYGYLNSFQVFLEAAGMFCAPWLVNRIGAKNGLIFAGMVMALRMVSSGLVEGPLLISITKLLHGVELPVLLVSIFKYNSANFDKRLSSTLYLVGFACTSSIIATVLSPIAGYSYEKYGFAESYLFMGALVFCTTFISIFLLRASKPTSDPLLTQPSAV
jgi:OHS family lactose permease-like MFS transporter